MARKIKGVTIQFGADMTEFNNAMSTAYNKSQQLSRELREVNKLLKFKPDDQDLYATGMSNLAKQIENAKSKLVELNKAFDTAKKEFMHDKVGADVLNALQLEIKETENDIKKFSRALEEMRKKASAFEELKAKISKVDESLKRNKQLLDEVNRALKLDPKNVGLVKTQQDLLNKSISETKDKINLCRQAQMELVKEYNRGTYSKNEYLEEYTKLRVAIIDAKDEIKNLARENDLLYQKMNKLSTISGTIGAKFKDIGRSLSAKVSIPIAGAMAMATKEAVALEDAMAGVRKTTDMTDTELAQMQGTFVEMSKTTPVAAKELANIGEIAGQLGIQKENIAGFAKTISDLTIATNLTAEQGAKDLARFMAITGETQDKVSNLGSTLVELGNNYATSEDEILEMSLRLAAQGDIAGLTSAQTMGIATALSAVGLKAEQGGSSFSRIMMKMQSAVLSTQEKIILLEQTLEGTGYTIEDVRNAIAQGGEAGEEALNKIGEACGLTSEDLKDLADESNNTGDKLELFAKVAGMSAQEFADMWRRDPIAAINAFLKGIKTMQASNQDLSQIFKDLGLNGIRETDTLQRLANAEGMLTDAVNDASEAYESNVALQKEVDTFNKTTGNQLKILKNDFVALGLEIGEVVIPILRDFVDWLKGIVEKAQEMDPAQIESWVKAFTGIALLGPAISILGSIFNGISAISHGIGVLSGGLAALKAGAEVTGVAVSGFGGILGKIAPMFINPTTGIVAGITLGVIALKELNDYMSQSSFASDIFGGKVSETTQKVVGSFLEMNNGVTTSLTSLKWSGQTITQETVDSISNGFQSMGEQISAKIEETKPLAIDSLNSYVYRNGYD